MKGLAQQRFKEAAGYFLGRKPDSAKWPSLEKALEAGCISYIDFALADYFLGNSCENSEPAAAFISHLSRAVREGHLCVCKRPGEIYPSPYEIWLSDLPEGYSNDIVHLIDRMVCEEIALPGNLIADFNGNGPLNAVKPFCRFKDFYYFQKYWLFEQKFIHNFHTLLKQNPAIPLDAGNIEAAVRKMLGTGTLNIQQAEAILNASKTCFSVICGGPGTGKTYTAGHLIRIFRESLPQELKGQYKIEIAAPTGKAANNLQNSLKKAVSHLEDFTENLSAKTLHSLLDLRISDKLSDYPESRLNADLILIDESSMIDVRVISYLFNAVKPGARIILLGDPNQLPPVEAGSAFADMINCVKGMPVRYLSELTECLRTDLKEIVDFSYRIKEGDSQSVLSHLNSNPQQAIKRAVFHNTKAVYSSLVESAEINLPPPFYDFSQDSAELLQAFSRFRFLSPVKNGPFGINEINRIIHKNRLAGLKDADYVTIPIMINTNDYKISLFNGEVGVLVFRKKHGFSFQKDDFAVFRGSCDKQYRKIPAILLPKFELSYCLSVHKSQGSEFDHVFLLLPEGAEKFGREVFYTAATRARKTLTVWGEDRIIQQTLSAKSDRLSGFHNFRKICGE